MSNGRITITDVAKQSGVSTATVSRYINSTGRVADETAARIQTVIDKLNYVPDSSAVSLAGGRTHTLGIVLPEISGSYFLPIIRGAETAAHNSQFDLLIRTTGGRHDVANHIPPSVRDRSMDGVILFPGCVAESELHRLCALDYPLVLLFDLSPAGCNIPSVGINNIQGSIMAVNHLLVNCGRTRVAHLIGDERQNDAHQRKSGYLQAINHRPILGDGGFSAEIAQQTVTTWLENGEEFDAIFAADDQSATGALTALRKHGKRVPDDVAIIGFDDEPVAQHASVPLTTVHVPLNAIGRTAMNSLIQWVAHDEKKSNRTTLDTMLTIRESCGYR